MADDGISNGVEYLVALIVTEQGQTFAGTLDAFKSIF
jgi:hypothetical protein